MKRRREAHAQFEVLAEVKGITTIGSRERKGSGYRCAVTQAYWEMFRAGLMEGRAQRPSRGPSLAVLAQCLAAGALGAFVVLACCGGVL